MTIQMRQNTMSIRAQVEAAIMSTRIQFQLASASSKEIGEAWFDDEDRRKEVRRGHSIRGALLISEWQFLQRARGILPSMTDEQEGQIIASVFERYPDAESMWDSFRGTFSPEFVEWFEEQRAKAA